MTIVDIITQTMTLVTCGMERCLGCPLPSGRRDNLFSVPTFSTVFILGPHTCRRHHTPPHYNNIAVQYTIHGGGGGKSLDLGRGQM